MGRGRKPGSIVDPKQVDHVAFIIDLGQTIASIVTLHTEILIVYGKNPPAEGCGITGKLLPIFAIGDIDMAVTIGAYRDEMPIFATGALIRSIHPVGRVLTVVPISPIFVVAD